MTFQPLPRDPIFVRLHGKAVHVVSNRATARYQDATDLGDPALAPYLAENNARPPREAGDTPDGGDIINFLLGVITTRCGREIIRNRGGLAMSGTLTDRFDDEDLCRACHRTVAPEDQGRLFEHPQENDDLDNERHEHDPFAQQSISPTSPAQA